MVRIQNYLLFYILITITFFSVNNHDTIIADDSMNYKIEQKITENIEIRKYEKLLLATIIIDNNLTENDGFKQLFNFISGANSKKEKIEMTSPVLKKIGVNKISMSFVMPTSFTEKTLPKPNNKEIKIEYLQNKRFIALTFSNSSRDSKFEEKQKKLAEIIKEKKIKVNDENVFRAYYNSPWTLIFLKRNEILFEIK